MELKYSNTLCVILHYGSESYTNECINSLLNVKHLDIIISDNDPSQSYEPPKQIKNFVKIIKTGGAVGFAEGNNIGVNAHLNKYHGSILILNNDTIVIEGAIDYLRDTLYSKGDSVGAVGPCMPFASNTKKIWACGGYINKYKVTAGGLQPKSKQPYQVDYLPGAAILCRSELWKDIGGLNEEYFMAYEEVEFALEIKKKKFNVLVDPRAIILHHVGLTSQNSPENYYNSIRNRLIFSKYLYGKNIGFVYAIIVTFLAFFKPRSFKENYQRIQLWRKAILDYLKNVPLNRRTIQTISKEFKKNDQKKL
jgi:GT2 family glycosyltransferase